MKKLIIIIISLTIFLFLISCGHKKSPTGGKKDTINPEIVSVTPDEYSNISDSNIEIIFSKPIERNSILSGIYIHPPILKKKYIWDGNILTIKIMEELENDTNYYFNFSSKIKGEHGNFLSKNSTYIFASGELNSNRISGNFSFEKIEDANKKIQMTILTSDSTEVFSKVAFGGTYIIEDLNKVEYIIRAFIDKNTNEKYDYESEPYFQEVINPVTSSITDIYLSYADTLKPEIESATVKYNNNINIKFSEPIVSVSEILIVTADSLETNSDVIAHYLYEDELSILTTNLDTLKYKITIKEIIDSKDNITGEGALLIDGNTLIDSIPPEVVSSTPRTGSSVNTFLPKISVHFSEIILEDDIETQLIEIETGNVEDVVVLNSNSKHYIFSSQHKLNNYSSYKFNVSAKDINGNIMMNPLEIIFLPIVRVAKKE